MDKTFCETQGQAPFDWNRFLDRAIAEGVSREEYAAACELAYQWTTCACGNQCAIIPRYRGHPDLMDGRPRDNMLAQLGGDFFAKVQAENFHAAKQTLRDIEARSAVLIAKELAKLQ